MNFYDISEAFQAFWPVLVTLVGIILWFGKLESTTRDLERRVKALEDKNDDITKMAQTIIAIDSKLTVLLPGYNGIK